MDSAEVFERICLHDLGEAKMGDVSLVNKVHRLKPDEKNLERKAFTQMTKNLPVSIKNKFLSWFDEHEGFVSGGDLRLETLMARWLDNLAGDHFTLTFGANFSKYSDIIEKIVKKRSAARGRALIDCLQKKAQIDKKKARLYLTATDEIEEVMKFHIGQIRKVGVKIDLTEFGF